MRQKQCWCAAMWMCVVAAWGGGSAVLGQNMQAGARATGSQDARTSQDAAAKLPTKLLSGIASYRLNVRKRNTDPDHFIKAYLDPMARAGFNAIQVKFFAHPLDLSDPKQYAQLKKVVEAAHQRHMAFLAYFYPDPQSANRSPKQDADLPAVVTENGRTNEHKFSMISWPVWRKLFDNAFQTAKVSRKLGIAAVELDLEHNNTNIVSYDDQAWTRFAKSHEVDPSTPAKQRGALVKRKHLKKVYRKWFFDQLGKVVQRYEREMHRINPDLHLGFMPAKIARDFYKPFAKYLSTAQAPAIIDSWVMYGGGFDPHALDLAHRVKQANPHNLFLPWFRINRYRPRDIPHQAYHAAMATAGFSNWTMVMLDPKWPDAKVLRLPDKYTRQQYYHAYAKANRMIRAAVASGKNASDIPFVPVKPLPPALSLQSIKVPDLKPAGSGKGDPQWLSLRMQQVIYVQADEAKKVTFDVRPSWRNAIRLRYGLVGADGEVLTDKTVTIKPKQSRHFSIAVPRPGTYGLGLVAGGRGASSYDVRIRNKHMGLAVGGRRGALVFYAHPMDLWVTRSEPRAPAYVVVKPKNQNQYFRVQLDDKPAYEGTHAQLAIPAGRKVSHLKIRKPKKHVAGMSYHHFWVTTQGAAYPWFADGPERRLVRPGEGG